MSDAVRCALSDGHGAPWAVRFLLGLLFALGTAAAIYAGVRAIWLGEDRRADLRGGLLLLLGCGICGLYCWWSALTGCWDTGAASMRLGTTPTPDRGSLAEWRRATPGEARPPDPRRG